MDPQELLAAVEAHLSATGQAPTAFGRAVNGDTKLVFDMRDGRELRRSTVEKILSYLDGNTHPTPSNRAGRAATSGTVRIQLDHRVTFDQAQRIFAILNEGGK